ncbi:hypothetical protein HMPREF1861_01941 [Corynebacterium kroppenstedtii]|nr:hypothetical protein HMPREF1861_01941 [Corynebacterium kroppenstedtii]
MSQNYVSSKLDIEVDYLYLLDVKYALLQGVEIPWILYALDSDGQSLGEVKNY